MPQVLSTEQKNPSERISLILYFPVTERQKGEMLIKYKNTVCKDFFPSQFWVNDHDNIYFSKANEDSQNNFPKCLNQHKMLHSFSLCFSPSPPAEQGQNHKPFVVSICRLPVDLFWHNLQFSATDLLKQPAIRLAGRD